MVRPKELVESVLYSLKRSDQLPSDANFVGYEPDINSESIKLPLVEVSLNTQVEVSEMNTDFVRFKTDDQGRQVGRIYESLYTQEVSVSVWTAQGSRYSPRDMGNAVRDVLYAHTTSGPDQPLRHPDDDRELDEVWRLTVTEGAHTDDLGTSPTLRRWQELLQISASEQYVTNADEPPVETINARLEQDEDISGFETSFTVQ